MIKAHCALVTTRAGSAQFVDLGTDCGGRGLLPLPLLAQPSDRQLAIRHDLQLTSGWCPANGFSYRSQLHPIVGSVWFMTGVFSNNLAVLSEYHRPSSGARIAGAGAVGVCNE